MAFNPDIHHRRSIRLTGHDYTGNGACFITICTHERELLLGEIVGGVMVLNETGEIVRNEWMKTTDIRPTVTLDEFVVMPNHFHGIIIIHNEHDLNATGFVGAKQESPASPAFDDCEYVGATAQFHRVSPFLGRRSKAIEADKAGEADETFASPLREYTIFRRI